MDNPEKLATYGTQDEGTIKNGQPRETGNIGYTIQRGNQNGQSRETGNIGYTRRRTKKKSTDKIGICCFSAKHATIRNESVRRVKARNQDYVSVSGATCLSAHCCCSAVTLNISVLV